MSGSSTNPKRWPTILLLAVAICPPLAILLVGLQGISILGVTNRLWVVFILVVLYEIAFTLITFVAKVWQQLEKSWIDQLMERIARFLSTGYGRHPGSYQRRERRFFLSSHVPTPSSSSGSSYPMSSEHSSSVLQLRITEEPLTAWNLTTILSVLTSLHTKCWLIVQRRFADTIEYAQTHDERFINEAHLIIEKLTHNSPADIKLNVNADVSAQGVAEALKTGIDAVIQAPFRREEAKIANEAHALDLQIKEQEAQSTLADKEQSRQSAARLAALDEKARQLDLEAKQLDLEARRLELQEKRLELETKRINVALETASKMIALLQPNADQETKEMLSRALLPDLLQLGNGKGLELPLLPSSQSNEKNGANESS